MRHREVLIEKHYRSVLSRAVIDPFLSQQAKVCMTYYSNEVLVESAHEYLAYLACIDAQSPDSIAPCIASGKNYLIHVMKHKLYFLAVLRSDGVSMPACM